MRVFGWRIDIARIRTADPEAYRIAYEEGQRALDEQERSVDELRGRSGTLFAAAALVTSFFGGAVFPHHLPTAGWVAIGCFIGLGGCVLAILWPRRDWEFAASPARVISEYIEPADDRPVAVPAMHRDLALHMDASWRANRTQLRILTATFRVGAGLLVAEVIAWVIVLADHA
jgi:hypothetical protein